MIPCIFCGNLKVHMEHEHVVDDQPMWCEGIREDVAAAILMLVEEVVRATSV